MTPTYLRRLLVPLLLVALALGPFLSGQDREVELPVPADAVKQRAEVEQVTVGARGLVFHDPAWIPLTEGDPWLAWMAFQPLLGDRVLAARVGDGPPEAVEVVDGEPGELLGLVGALNEHGEPQLVWTRLDGTRAHLVTSWRAPGGWAAQTWPAEKPSEKDASLATPCGPT